MSALLRPLAVALATMALAEFVLLRVLLRMGPLLPAGETVTGILSWAYRAGLWSLNLAGVLAVATLALLALNAARERRLAAVASGAAAAAAALLLLAGWALALAGGGSGAVLVTQVVGLPAALALATVASGWRGWRRGWLWLVYGVYLAASAHYLARLAGAAEGTGTSLALAEALAAAAALSAPWALGVGWQPRAAALAALAAVLYTGFMLSQPSIAAFFAIWDMGFGSAIPGALRGLALAGLAYAVVAGLARPGLRLAALGLGLVTLGGLRLDYTYFGLLAAAGFLLLAAGPFPAGERAPAPGLTRGQEAA